ncbi:MAG TPA: ABC transporter permease, partial [Thermotogaceae bacterium]|nr:ABC transporter permease [Thermotogaceae bacterium]
IIYFSINLFMATLSFWLMDVVSSMVLVHHLSEFAKYPLIIYHKAVQITLTWIIPYAFTAFFPAAFLLKKGSLILSFLTPAVAILIFLIAYSFWNFGLRRYQSSGS